MQRTASPLRLSMTLLLLAGLFFGAAGQSLARGGEGSFLINTVPQPVGFIQNWSNIGLITADDDWSGVAGIVGYRGDGLASTGDDPQTILSDGSATPVDVNANQTNTSSATGGISEFEIVDPVVALQGSGTADAPHIVIHLDTSGFSNIFITYNVRDIDGSVDDAVQRVALQYRVGSSGNFTNIPGGYIADATTGPSLATLVTPVSVTLPSAADDRPEVEIRIITADATGSDEWVGIDDINVTGTDITPAVSSTSPVNNATNVALNSNITISFNEPVDVAPDWFTIACGISGSHTATVIPPFSNSVFILDPDIDFVSDEICVVIINASLVTDQDTDDPPQEMATSYAFNFSTVSSACTPTSSGTVRSVIINEVAWMGTLAATSDEWIELYNPSSSPICLTNWKLEAADGLPSIQLTGAIQPGQYLILERGDDNVISDFNAPGDPVIVYNGDLLSDNGETLRLLAPDRSIIDTANGNGGAWPAGTLSSASNHGTMERMDLTADSDSLWVTNVNSGSWSGHDAGGNQIHGTPGGLNWGNGVTHTPTPTATATSTNTPTSTTTPPKTVTITEVAWMGTQASSSDEWIELYNNTSIPISLSGWKLRATDGTPNISLSGTIAPNDYFLLERTDQTTVSDITGDFIFTGEIGNSNETLTLYDPLNHVVDTANANGGAWPAGNSVTFGSMERAGKQLNDVDTSWFTHTGASPRWGKDKNGNAIKGTPKHDNWAFGVTATATATRTPTPTGTLPPTPVPFKAVVISEVAWMGTSSSTSSDEWIELFNNTTEPVDLNGWRLRSYRYSGGDFYLNLNIALTGVIQPRDANATQGNTSGYYLLETRTNAVNYPGGNDPQGQIYTGSLYNTGEILLLCSPYNLQVAFNCNVNTKNQIVDFVNGSLNTNGSIKPWAAGSSTTYGSMERKNVLSDEETAYFTHTGLTPRSGQDANGNAIKGTPGHPNWAFTVTATPRITPTLTPTRTPTRRPAAAPILEINEILARAGTDWNNDGSVDVYDEYIEVINYGTVSLNLSGYRLDDYELDASGKVIANAFTLPSQTLQPGEKAVFYGSQTGIRLDDSGDTVRLLRSNGDVVDARTYPIVKALDWSICRYRDGFVSWVMGCFPTPGLPNQLTGSLPVSTSNGQPLHVCVLADSVPMEFVLAECGESGLGIWNPFYWDSFPGEGNQIWQSDERDKWIVIYQ